MEGNLIDRFMWTLTPADKEFFNVRRLLCPSENGRITGFTIFAETLNTETKSLNFALSRWNRRIHIRLIALVFKGISFPLKNALKREKQRLAAASGLMLVLGQQVR